MAAAKPRSGIDVAEGFLDLARREADEGYKTGDERRIRDAAEKTWLAVNEAVDHAMRSHGMTPTPGPQAHVDRHEFLEDVAGRRDISEKLSDFATRVHGHCFYMGKCPTRQGMAVRIEEAEQLVRELRDL